MSVHISETELQELYMLELQGTITCTCGIFGGKNFGAVTFNERGNPELSIGSRILEGKLEKLKTPITALQKTDEWSAYQGNHDLRSREMKAIGVIRSKLIFSVRPRIISGA